MSKDQTTTPGTPCPTLCDECVGSLTSPADHNSEDAGDGAYGLSSLSEKTRISNHLQMSLQRQHILLSYFKTLSVGPVWGLNPRPPARYSDALPTELTGRRLNQAFFSQRPSVKLKATPKTFLPTPGLGEEAKMISADTLDDLEVV